MVSWLNKQKKATLVGLGAEAGLQLDDDLRKDELVDQLDAYLQQNATRLSRNDTFEGYYASRRTPNKIRDVSDDGDVKSVVRGRGRRATTVKREPDSDGPTSPSTTLAAPSTVTRYSQPTTTAGSPNIIQRRRSSLPPSPSLVVNEVEQATDRFYSNLDTYYTSSGIPETIAQLRETCSTLAAVHATFLFLEAYNLHKTVMPWKYAFDVPYSPIFGTPSFAVKLPDLFVLLTSAYWAPTLTWATFSIAIPLAVSYFYNLTVHNVKRNNARVRVVRYTYDPLVFNVTRAMAAYLVYKAEILFPYVSEQTRTVLVGSQYQEMFGFLVGPAVSGLLSIWEATQR